MAEETHSDQDDRQLAQASFAVFANRMMLGLANENSSIEKENARLRPLLDYLKSIEIRIDGEVVAHCSLDPLSMNDDEFGRSFTVKIDKKNTSARPLEKYSFSPQEQEPIDRVATLYLANVLVGRIPDDIVVTIQMQAGELVLIEGAGQRLHSVIGSVKVTDNELRFGRLEELKDNIRRYIMGDRTSLEPGVTFTPFGLFFRVTDEVDEFLQLIDPPSEDRYLALNQDPSHEQRNNIITVLGNQEYVDMLQRNRELKIEQFHLSTIRTKLGSVTMTYNGLNPTDRQLKFNISLDRGRHVVQSGKSIWRVYLGGREFTVPASYLHKFGAQLSGVPLILENENVALTQQGYSVLDHTSTFSSGLKVRGFFYDEDGLIDIESHEGASMIAASLNNPYHSTVPPSVKLDIIAIEFELSFVEKLLRTLGLDVHLDNPLVLN